MKGPLRLQFDGLSRRFGPVSVLRDVSGEVSGGGLLLVTGPNGCGKSTLLRCLAGLLAPDAGSIALEIDGRRAVDDPATRRGSAGYLSPDLAFYDELSVGENLTFFARLRRVDPASAFALAAELKLPLGRLAGVLSSGMRQRLRWIWMELASPAVLLLDEPLQNLDAEGAEALSRRLARRLEAGALAVVANPSRLDFGQLPEEPRELRLAG